MILSVSRRTDIPAFYSDWFIQRLKEGFLYVKNPINPHQVSKIPLSPEVVDCIVFWTKNPANIIERLGCFKDYMHYFQFTLTGYGKDIEPNVPDKRDMLEIFKRLSKKIGKERVIWRYDPIFLSKRYTVEYHLKAFGEIASSLSGYTKKAVISFVDFYANTKRNMKGIGVEVFTPDGMVKLAKDIAHIASRHHITVEACAEEMDFGEIGVSPGSCIDQKLVESLLGCKIDAKKDKNQRGACRCIESVEVGAYHTCLNGCKYCYANFNEKKVEETVKGYDVDSPILCGEIKEGDVVTYRKATSLKDMQVCLTDFDKNFGRKGF